MNSVLGLFAKWPQAGAVKTRLATDTSTEFAVRVADAFLGDSLERFASIPIRRILAFTPLQQESSFASIARTSWELEPQCDGDLGERLDRFFQTRFAEGCSRVVVLGTDSPTLPLEYVTDALESLKHRDVVIGPATDGGYYLLGLSRPLPRLFQAIRWSASDVLSQTVARLDAQLLALLPPWYDVDTGDDWAALCGHITAMRRAGLDPRVPRTELLIAESP